MASRVAYLEQIFMARNLQCVSISLSCRGGYISLVEVQLMKCCQAEE